MSKDSDQTPKNNGNLKRAPILFSYESIGIVHSCFPDKFGTPRQPGILKEAKGFLEIFPKFQPEITLDGFENFSHVWVLFHFHKLGQFSFHAKVHPPRKNGRAVGVFGTRSPHRPNPIGLSVLKIQEIKSDGIVVSGVDIVDGTPILDIKPYLPEVESIEEATSDWEKDLKKTELEIEWNPNALEQLRSSGSDFKNLIEGVIKNDPRPLAYKGSTSENRTQHAVRIHNGDIHFKMASESKVIIESITFCYR